MAYIIAYAMIGYRILVRFFCVAIYIVDVPNSGFLDGTGAFGA